MPSPFAAVFDRQRLLFPPLAGLYKSLAGPSHFVMRVMAGLALAVHGWPKIQDPFKNVGMAEGLGFYPGVVWSPLLAGTEFLGGILLAIGFLTRPAAIAATLVLLVTVWFHWIVQGQGYPGSEKSMLWAAMTFFLAVHGGGFLSVDRALRKEV
ncbi:thiosulfate dehydrogenase [quinone] large subunit [Burkholderiales bacterium]|nr:thiosulfate dehydrogenase [quinone] large subunit [Burkholderiales bacterium]